MCGIIGIFDKIDASVQVINGLKLFSDRGKDKAGIASLNKIKIENTPKELSPINSQNVIGHVLHSVVGEIPQPLKKNKNLIVANCEIYNWIELKKKYSLKSKNDAELILDLINLKGPSKIKSILNELDGVFAFCYWDSSKNIIYLARDLLGIKPIWYDFDKEGNFAFASEKKALVANNYAKPEEMNPRSIFKYDITNKKLTISKRDFFKIGHTHKESKEQIISKTEKLLEEAIRKRIPSKRKFGLLFSGGIDSTFLAYKLKQWGYDFTCYTAALSEEGMEEADDLVHSIKIADELGLKLKVKKLNLAQTEKLVEKVVPLIEDNNVVKAGVGLTFYAACDLAKKDGIKVIFSGLGSEEIFAGYERHKLSHDINKECYSGLLKMYERDLYRDDVITMNNNLELRVPFLDKKLIQYALGIPAKYKLDDKQSKKILREIAKKDGIPDIFSERKKKAAQYGSKFHKALQKLARKNGKAKISDYLYTFYQPPNVKLGVLWSGGKDGAYAAWTMEKQNYEITCLISLKSENPDSYMFHTPNIDIVDMHAKAMEKPIIIQKTRGEKELELIDLKTAIEKAKYKYGVQGIVTGALYSNYQRERIEKICDELELKIFSPLWHIDQELEMRSLMREGFKIIFSAVAAYGLDKSWLGREISEKDVDKLSELNDKIGINIAGEGGEFESLVMDAPFFNQKICIDKSSSYFDSDGQGRFLIESAKLCKK